MTASSPRRNAPQGLSASELAALLPELDATLQGTRVADVARLADRDDLLLFLTAPDGQRKLVLHVVPGGTRGRVVPTTRRFPRQAFATGPLVDRLRTTLAGATWERLVHPSGERRCVLYLRAEDGRRLSLEVELFGNRGLWCVVDPGGTILELSRLPETKDRDLRPGVKYEPPRGKAGPPREAGETSAARFTPPLLDSIDRWFTAQDEAAEGEASREHVVRLLAAARKRAEHRVQGLQQQLAAAQDAPGLRREADLLLAHAHAVRRGQESLTVPDPEREGETVTLALDPLLPAAAQAQARYKKARKQEDALATAAVRGAEAEAELAAIVALEGAVAAGRDLAEVQRELQQRGLWREPPPAAGASAPAKPKPTPAQRKLERQLGEGFRRFTSAEGHTILAGKSNEQNDRLSLRVARGNDLWFHVGQGHAGSHVVVQLPKGKTASLETLLDAATVAVHFSKARGAHLCEVIYTQAKHVRKPKGLAPGQVVATQTKSLRVRLEEGRLRRVLDSAGRGSGDE